MDRWPKPRLLKERPPDSRPLANLRGLKDLPAEVWQRLFLVALKRLEKKDPSFAETLSDQAAEIAFTISNRQEEFYEEHLDQLERWAPGNKYGINVIKAYVHFRHERDKLRIAGHKQPAAEALRCVGGRFGCSAASLRAAFSKVRLDLHSSDMWPIPGSERYIDILVPAPTRGRRRRSSRLGSPPL